jgi:hypothetical protein
MRRSLTLHPQSPRSAATQIEVEFARPSAAALELTYTLAGNTNDLLMPALTAAARADELWRHTCFEAFVRAPAAAEYYELNFAPSTQWAAYRYTGDRAGRAAAAIEPIEIDVQNGNEHYALQASLLLSELAHSAVWRLGLSAVIEDKSGRKSYWALTHPPGPPDFHHADSFALALSSPVQP